MPPRWSSVLWVISRSLFVYLNASSSRQRQSPFGTRRLNDWITERLVLIIKWNSKKNSIVLPRVSCIDLNNSNFLDSKGTKCMLLEFKRIGMNLLDYSWHYGVCSFAADRRRKMVIFAATKLVREDIRFWQILVRLYCTWVVDLL